MADIDICSGSQQRTSKETNICNSILIENIIETVQQHHASIHFAHRYDIIGSGFFLFEEKPKSHLKCYCLSWEIHVVCPGFKFGEKLVFAIYTTGMECKCDYFKNILSRSDKWTDRHTDIQMNGYPYFSSYPLLCDRR